MKNNVFKAEILRVKIKKLEFKLHKFDISSKKNNKKSFKNKILNCCNELK